MQLSTKWEIITRALKDVLGSRNDNFLTIGGHVLAVPSIEHHLVGALTLVGYSWQSRPVEISALVNL